MCFGIRGIFFLNKKGLEVEFENEKILINDLEMSKNHTYKIMITDMVIEKVLLIKYREIPESEYLML